MNVLHLCTFDTGGAGIAARRLCEAQQASGITARLLHLHPNRTPNGQPFFAPPSGITRYSSRFFEAGQALGLPLRAQHQRQHHLRNKPPGYELFSTPFSAHRPENSAWFQQADVIHLHWVSGLVHQPTFFKALRGKRVVWTLHDQAPFTGGCHYSLDCHGFENDCARCPQLGNPADAAPFLRIKKESLSGIKNLHVISPSNWIRQASERSSLFGNYTHHTIANPVSGVVFRPLNRAECRSVLGLPQNQFLALFVSLDLSNPRKGGAIIQEAAQHFANHPTIQLVGLGKSNGDAPYLNLGNVRDERLMAMVYSASDVVLFPSFADNLPNVVSEAHRCGTPVLAFRLGGLPEMIEHEKNGWLTQPNSSAFCSMLERIASEPALDREAIAAGAEAAYSPSCLIEKISNVYHLAQPC
jgi:glycosyltransferase involved in cell wall biosynthesis